MDVLERAEHIADLAAAGDFRAMNVVWDARRALPRPGESRWGLPLRAIPGTAVRVMLYLERHPEEADGWEEEG